MYTKELYMSCFVEIDKVLNDF